MRPSCGTAVSPFIARAAFTPANRGIIIADTKFEFGLHDDKILLIDECLTPDSSRFWPADSYEVGTSPLSYDKQFVRDYLETLDWDKTPPAPRLSRRRSSKRQPKNIKKRSTVSPTSKSCQCQLSVSVSRPRGRSRFIQTSCTRPAPWFTALSQC